MMKRPDFLKHDAGYFDGEQYVFDAEVIKEGVDWADLLEEELADYKKHFEPQMIQIRLHRQAVAHQEETYEVGPDIEMKPSDDGELMEMNDEQETNCLRSLRRRG